MAINNPLEKLFHNDKPLSEAEWDILIKSELKKKFLDPIKRYQPDPNSFTDIYKKSDVEQNLALVQKRKGAFEKEKHDRAFLGEALLYYVINKKQLLGKHVEALAASEFDDLVHGVDLIFEILGKDGVPFWIAVDITTAENHMDANTGENRDVALEKVEKIYRELREGKLAKVEYLESESDDETGKKIRGTKKMPKIVLRLSHDDVKYMATSLPPDKFDGAVLGAELINQISSQLKEGAKEIRLSNNLDSSKKNTLINIYEKALQSISPNS